MKTQQKKETWNPEAGYEREARTIIKLVAVTTVLFCAAVAIATWMVVGLVF